MEIKLKKKVIYTGKIVLKPVYILVELMPGLTLEVPISLWYVILSTIYLIFPEAH